MKQVDQEALETSSLANSDEVGRRQVLEAKLQEIVEDINENRKQHTNTMAKFKKELENKACNTLTCLEMKHGLVIGLIRLTTYCTVMNLSA